MFRRSVTAFGCASLLAYQLFSASTAFACSRAEDQPFLVDAGAVDDNAEGPSAFREVTSLSYRIEGTRCSGDSCTASSCGDMGILLLRFEPPAEADEGELGYRMIWVGRPLPFAIRSQMNRILPLHPSMRAVGLEIGFDQIAALEGEIALVAVDRAGRESAPSELVPVSFSGCTEYFDQPYCIAGGPMPEPFDAPQCSVVSGVGHQHSPLLAAIAFAACALLAWRRKRSF